MEPLVTTDWLHEHLADPTVRVVDIRGRVVTRPLEPGVEEADYQGSPQEYLQSHIPGAVFVDWTLDIVDPDDPVPVQVAGPERFARAMSERGIGDSTQVVAVDHGGGQFATRLWWALHYHGHENVAVLDGGFNRWVAEGRPVVAGPVDVPPAAFTPRVQPAWRHTAEQLAARLGKKECQLLDARDAAQFTGAKRRGPRGGHIPGATHAPRELFFAEAGGFRPLDELRQAIAETGVDLDTPTVAYCNGGVAATVVLFNLYRLGARDLSNYDGSWNEWGPRGELPCQPSAPDRTQ